MRETIHISGRRWFDKVNGNTYHSARAYQDGELVAVAPYQYGYGDQWRESIAEELVKAGVLPDLQTPNGRKPLWQIAEAVGCSITSDCADVLKREVVDYGEDE